MGCVICTGKYDNISFIVKTPFFLQKINLALKGLRLFFLLLLTLLLDT